MGHASVALDGVGPKQEDLRDDRGLAQSSDRGRAPVCLSRRHRAQAQLGRRGAQRLAAGCDRRERERLSGDSRHLRGGEGRQDWLERVPQASQGTRVEGCPADHLGCLHRAYRERRRVLSRGRLAKVHRALVPQHLQPRALDQGAGDRGHAQGDPRQRGHRGSTREGHPSDRQAAWPALSRAAELVETAVEETLTDYAFPEEHWRRIRTNNPLERILREIRRRTRVVGAFPDGQSALNLAAARLRHIAGTAWSTKRYLNIELLKDQQMRGAITA